MLGLALFLAILYFGGLGNAFHHAAPFARCQSFPSTCLFSSLSDQQGLIQVRSFLGQNYPSFYNLIDKNEDLWKKLSDGDGYTMFCPSEQAFADLGQKKLDQLDDVRNSEIRDKIGAFHCIAETVLFDDLYNSGGVLTLGGEALTVDRSRTGGMFGMGGQEDGGLLVNGARVTNVEGVGPGMVYEVDKLVSPNILWRYMDQLRIPGSR
ncbi:hypothetical protein ACA910_015104 [Epithemia clementina (nom. ined.)]